MTPRLLLVLALAAAVATNIIANRRPGSQLRGPLGVIPERSNSRAPQLPAALVRRGQGRLLQRSGYPPPSAHPCEGSNRF